MQAIQADREPYQIGETARKRIGSKLRALYRHVVREPVPLEHIDLLLALRRTERDRRRSRDEAGFVALRVGKTG